MTPRDSYPEASQVQDTTLQLSRTRASRVVTSCEFDHHRPHGLQMQHTPGCTVDHDRPHELQMQHTPGCTVDHHRPHGLQMQHTPGCTVDHDRPHGLQMQHTPGCTVDHDRPHGLQMHTPGCTVESILVQVHKLTSLAMYKPRFSIVFCFRLP